MKIEGKKIILNSCKLINQLLGVFIMETTSSFPKRIIILRWIARIIGTAVVLFMSSIFIGALISKGQINVEHPGHYVMFAFTGLSMIGILLAWRWEGLGGFLGAFGIITSDLLNIFWVHAPKMTGTLIGSLLWLIPSLIFIYCWWATKNRSTPLIA